MITIASIQAAVAARYHVSVKAMKGRRKNPRIIRPRHAAMYLSRRLTGHSLTVIGRHFGGRHHTTIMHGYQRTQERVHRNSKCERSIGTLIDELVG